MESSFPAATSDITKLRQKRNEVRECSFKLSSYLSSILRLTWQIKDSKKSDSGVKTFPVSSSVSRGSLDFKLGFGAALPCFSIETEIVELFIAAYSISVSANLTLQKRSKQLVCIMSMRRLC